MRRRPPTLPLHQPEEDPHVRLARGRVIYHRYSKCAILSFIAQLVEHELNVLKVDGSNPSEGANDEEVKFFGCTFSYCHNLSVRARPFHTASILSVRARFLPQVGIIICTSSLNSPTIFHFPPSIGRLNSERHGVEALGDH